MKSDLQIQQDVLAELQWDPSIHASQIGVEVQEGVVTLAGHVDSYVEKWHAESAAQRVAGVSAVAVELTVKLPGTSARTDTEIAHAAQNVLNWTTTMPKDTVKVLVEGGWVTLSGTVDWSYQKRAATEAVRHLQGVVGVSDQISTQTRVATLDVKADIEAALKRRAVVDARAISVRVNGGDVTLSGTVHSWSERDLARQTAWQAAGVSHVVDLLTVGH